MLHFLKQRPFLKSWQVYLLCMLLLTTTILFVQFHEPSATSAQGNIEKKDVLPPAPAVPAAPVTSSKSARSQARTPSIWPAQGTITSAFGWRGSPMGGGSELHPGIDIAYAMGAPVVATADGEVVVSGPAGGYGNLVQIDHGNGIATLYGHNSKVGVTVGQQVKKGQVIAYAGSTGRSTGTHVHYEIRVNGTAVDPMKYLVLY